MQAPAHPTRRFVAALSAALLISTGVGCSASGGDSADSTTTTATASTDNSNDPSDPKGDTTTSQAAEETTTTEASDNELASLLPTASEVPSDYREVEPREDDDDSDAEFDASVRKSCPDADFILELSNDDEKFEDEAAKRSFATDDDRGIEIELRPDSDREVDVDEVVDAYNACDTLSITVYNSPATLEITAEPADIGDQGIKIVQNVSGVSRGTAYTVSMTGFMFRRDGVAGEVLASSGFDSADQSVPADVDVAETLATSIDRAIQDR